MSSSIVESGFSKSCAPLAATQTQHPAHTNSAIANHRTRNSRFNNKTPAIFTKPFLGSTSSWIRMRCLIRMAARRLPRSKLHHFHARPVRIVRVETILPVAPNLGTIEFRQSLFLQLCRSRVCIPDAQRKMILHAQLFVVGIRRNIEHVLDPVASVRYLDLIPIDVLILESAMPIWAKPKDAPIKLVFDRDLFHHETRMENTGADLFRRNLKRRCRRSPLHEADADTVAFWIEHVEMRSSVGVGINLPHVYAARHQVPS